MDRSSPKRLRALVRYSYWIAPLLTAAVLVVAWRTRGNEVFSPGPLSREHALVGGACERCHAVTFGGLGNGAGASAMNAACLDCHGHRVAGDPIAPSIRHGHVKPVDSKLACSTCHREHLGAADIKAVDDAACIHCHRAASKPIASFGDEGAPGTHPDFRPESDPGTIRFNHKLHTGGATDAPRQVSLSCGECHRAGPRGEYAYQSPIEYARHCERCHETAVKVAGNDDLRVPHGTPETIRTFLAALGDRTSVTAAERALYSNEDGCAKCHQRTPGAVAEGLPAIAPSNIPQRWYLNARFDHGKHTAIAFHAGGTGPDASCAFCHSSVLVSTRAQDVAVPTKAVCRQCHGPDRKVSGRCATCHTFHESPAGISAYQKLEPALVADGERETRFGMRGSQALWPKSAFDALPNAVWKKPLTAGTEEFQREIFRRYGLFPADFPNDGLPLGLLKVDAKLKGNQDGITLSCDLCHSSSLFGRIVPGQPNRFCDIEQLWIDLSKASGEREVDPLYLKTPHHNTIINGADQLGLLGLIMRNGDLSIDAVTTMRIGTDHASYLKPEFDALAYVKTPPWYVYLTKQSGTAGYYFDGGHPKDGNFAAFTYLVSFWGDVRGALGAWQRAGHTYLASLTAPRYPFAIDQDRAARGRHLYDTQCGRCHGRYQGAATPEHLVYPGLVISAAEVGTNPLRANFPLAFGKRMRAILHKDYTFTRGYVAQPLTAIWAQAPYLHNGSVPTLAQLLEPSRRVARFALVCDPNDPRCFDEAEVGWRVEPAKTDDMGPGVRVFDPSLIPGLGNQGHHFGAELPPDQRTELIEFLKTL